MIQTKSLRSWPAENTILLMKLPPELIESLSSVDGNYQLTSKVCDEIGIESVTFHKLDAINPITFYVNVDEYIENYSDESHDLAGNYYPIEALDLLREVPGYRAFGILVWIPRISEFASFDEDHCVLRSFPGKTWKDIVANPKGFINCLWYPDQIDNHLVRPWNDKRFDSTPTKNPIW